MVGEFPYRTVEFVRHSGRCACSSVEGILMNAVPCVLQNGSLHAHVLLFGAETLRVELVETEN